MAHSRERPTARDAETQHGTHGLGGGKAEGMGSGQLYRVSRPQCFTYFKTYSWAVDYVDFID